MIKLIVGLGNPGPQYEKTRHNAGFLFLDHMVNLHRGRWAFSGQFQGEVASLVLGTDRLELLKPMTFMNRSGLSVGKFLRYYKLKPDEMLIVHDELELAECVVRLKRDGGHSGHNGLRDIISNIESRDFFRLRIGVGRPSTGVCVADYVLSKPGRDVLSRMVEVFGEIERNLELLFAGEIEKFNSNFSV